MSKDVLASLCIITYNQEQYISDLLDGALTQDYDSLEIIISDDNSTDRTFEIIETRCREYCGKHSIILNRNEKNLGLIGNLNKALQLTKGKYIAFAAGDDRIYNNRVSTAVEELTELNVSSITYNMLKIDHQSNPLGNYYVGLEAETQVYTLDDYITKKYFSCGASRVIDRNIIEVFGLIDESCPTEDSVFNLRAFLIDGLAFSPHILGDYRIHSSSISSHLNLLTKINPVLIYNQYRKDLELAYKLNYISSDTYKVILKDIKSYLSKEIAIRHLYSMKGLIRRFCLWLRFLPSYRFNLAFKRFLFSKIIEWHRQHL